MRGGVLVRSFRCSIKVFSIALSLSVVLGGCTENGDITTTGVGTLAGGALGAGLGAIVGNQSGDAATGLVVGAAAGAAAGGMIGRALQSQQEQLAEQRTKIAKQEQIISAQRQEVGEWRASADSAPASYVNRTYSSRSYTDNYGQARRRSYSAGASGTGLAPNRARTGGRLSGNERRLQAAYARARARGAYLRGDDAYRHSAGHRSSGELGYYASTRSSGGAVGAGRGDSVRSVGRKSSSDTERRTSDDAVNVPERAVSVEGKTSLEAALVDSSAEAYGITPDGGSSLSERTIGDGEGDAAAKAGATEGSSVDTPRWEEPAGEPSARLRDRGSDEVPTFVMRGNKRLDAGVDDDDLLERPDSAIPVDPADMSGTGTVSGSPVAALTGAPPAVSNPESVGSLKVEEPREVQGAKQIEEPKKVVKQPEVEAKVEEAPAPEPVEKTGSADESSPEGSDAPLVADDSEAAFNPSGAKQECQTAAEELSQGDTAADSSDKLFHYRRALRLCPNQAPYHAKIGEVYLALNRLGDAEFEFKQALAIDPKFVPALQGLKKAQR